MQSPETTDVSTVPIRVLEQATAEARKPAERSGQTPAEPPVALCPRCGGKLVSPENLGWCPKCRYCRTVEEDAPKVARASSAVATSSLGMVEFFNLLSRLPCWFWIMTGCLILIAIISSGCR